MVEIKQNVKKPTTVGQKYWEIAWKLTQYGANFINLPENISKCPKQFETWCLDPLALHPPSSLFDRKMEFMEHLALLANYKEKTFGYLAHELIKDYLPNFVLKPLRFRQIFEATGYKYPIISRQTLEQMKKWSSELNEGHHSLVRISKLPYQKDMKK